MNEILKKFIMVDKVYLIKIPENFTANTINVLKIPKEIKGKKYQSKCIMANNGLSNKYK